MLRGTQVSNWFCGWHIKNPHIIHQAQHGGCCQGKPIPCSHWTFWPFTVGANPLFRQNQKATKQQRGGGMCQGLHPLRAQLSHTSVFPISLPSTSLMDSDVIPHFLKYEKCISSSSTFPAWFVIHLFLLMECRLVQALLFGSPGKK